MNILFTGVGRRVELLQAFREAATYLNKDIKIYGADMAGTASAMAFCDFTRIICGMKEEAYISELMEICRKDSINLLIPTIDTDLLVLAENKERFCNIGTKVLVSSLEKVQVCRDKNQTSRFFKGCGLSTPISVRDWNEYKNGYPAFIKPKDGSSSIHTYKIKDKAELEHYASQMDGYIIQPYIEGTEYTVDIFCDFEGNPVYITPRIRMAVRSGEVLKTKIDLDEKIIKGCKRIIHGLRPCGPITVQLIREKKSGIDYYIEINPRFGGGAPLSMKAGARSAETILRLMGGEGIGKEKNCIENGALYSRFDQSVCVKHGKGPHPIKGVIFDLDDTLYLEKEYVKSGYKAVGRYLDNEGYATEMWRFFEKGKPAIDGLLKRIGKEELREACLRIYREHHPDIHLLDGIKERIIQLKADGIKVGVITDGRPEGQRKKIEALGLGQLMDDIIITDELGGIQFRKPCDIAFRIMQTRWKLPFEELMYVGDNINKDFQAPRQLGMQTAYVRNEGGLYLN